MPGPCWLASRSTALIALIALSPTIGYADAILPSLVLIWPITILLLIPIVVVEALYSKSHLGMNFWEAIRVMGVANILSSIVGLPIASLLSVGLQYGLECLYFRDLDKLHQTAVRSGLGLSNLSRHDYAQLVFLGMYPRWIVLVSAVAMLIVCFFVSWWAEAKWVQRYIRRSGRDVSVRDRDIRRTSRNANLLSYGFVILAVLWLLTRLWPNGVIG